MPNVAEMNMHNPQIKGNEINRAIIFLRLLMYFISSSNKIFTHPHAHACDEYRAWIPCPLLCLQSNMTPWFRFILPNYFGYKVS